MILRMIYRSSCWIASSIRYSRIADGEIDMDPSTCECALCYMQRVAEELCILMFLGGFLLGVTVTIGVVVLRKKGSKKNES